VKSGKNNRKKVLGDRKVGKTIGKKFWESEKWEKRSEKSFGGTKSDQNALKSFLRE
jgi:hypothetical protein